MTLGWRLLRGYAASQALGAVPFELTPNGFWNDVAEYRAAYYNGKTYFGFNNDTGDFHVSSYDHSSGAVSTPFLVGSGFTSPSGDIHNSIGVTVRNSDHRILITELFEGEDQPYARLTTNPEDATAWGSAYHVLASGDYTYCSLVQLNDGTIYLFTRSIVAGVFYIAFATSTDGGATFGTVNLLLSPVGDTGTYWRIGTDGTKIHITTTDTLRTTGIPSSLYHCYLDGGVLHKSDGTAMSSSWPRPVNEATLIQNDSLGPVSSMGVAVDGSGNPACVMVIYDAAATKELIYAARWNGSAWVVTAVTDNGALPGGFRFLSGAAIVKTNPDILYVSRQVGSHWEMFRYTSIDGGATWTGDQLTFGSSQDHLAPDTVVDAAPGLAAIWGYGTLTDGTTYAMDVWGVGA